MLYVTYYVQYVFERSNIKHSDKHIIDIQIMSHLTRQEDISFVGNEMGIQGKCKQDGFFEMLCSTAPKNGN